MRLALKLQSKLDRERTAAGDEVKETFVEDVLDAVTKKVVIPAGCLVICRVLHFEHYLRPDYFILTLSPERVQLQKGWARIAAIRDAPPESGAIEQTVIGPAGLPDVPIARARLGQRDICLQCEEESSAGALGADLDLADDSSSPVLGMARIASGSATSEALRARVLRHFPAFLILILRK